MALADQQANELLGAPQVIDHHPGAFQVVKGSGTYINKEAALSWELGGSGGKLKIGLILQGQDGNANSSLMEGIRSILPPDQVDLRTFLTDNKFSNERHCLQTVINQGAPS